MTNKRNYLTSVIPQIEECEDREVADIGEAESQVEAALSHDNTLDVLYGIIVKLPSNSFYLDDSGITPFDTVFDALVERCGAEITCNEFRNLAARMTR